MKRATVEDLMEKEITVKQPEVPVPTEILADCIVAIADGVRKIRSGRLNDKAIVLLICNAAPSYGGKYAAKKHVSAWQVKAVLDAMTGLERAYLKPRASK